MPQTNIEFWITSNNFAIGTPLGGSLAIFIEPIHPLEAPLKMIVDGGIEELNYIYGITSLTDLRQEYNRAKATTYVIQNNFMNAFL